MTMANLYYVIGPSGSGKDSLLQYVRDNMPENAGVVFAHRYITRSAGAGGENHIALSEQEFLHRQQQGCFAMHWRSHQTYYGLGVEIDIWLSKGLSVVMNGSREYLNEAARRYENLLPVLISVDPGILEKRLQARAREDAAQQQMRLKQAIKLQQNIRHPRLFRIENNGALEAAGDRLMTLILAPSRSA